MRGLDFVLHTQNKKIKLKKGESETSEVEKNKTKSAAKPINEPSV